MLVRVTWERCLRKSDLIDGSLVIVTIIRSTAFKYCFWNFIQYSFRDILRDSSRDPSKDSFWNSLQRFFQESILILLQEFLPNSYKDFTRIPPGILYVILIRVSLGFLPGFICRISLGILLEIPSRIPSGTCPGFFFRIYFEIASWIYSEITPKIPPNISQGSLSEFYR